ncbi:MAG: hypothetical protein ACSHWW_10360 [Nonlabens sp.]|uniref:hypothetical protein n=1 Tax=Nonlabens sp. TaxID=1888209 RepID=UPI003EF7EB11
MIKKAIILFMACAIISCKKEINDTPLDVKGAIDSSRLVKDFTCGSTTYVFQIPFYKGDSDVQDRLNNDVKNLITQDFVDVTYNKDAGLEEIWGIFINDRERKICNGDMSGVNNIHLEHLSQNEGMISYELVYSKNGKKSRMIKTYKKPDLTELKIIELAQPAKEDDVRRIFDINLQQAVANLSLDIKPEDYDGFREFITSKPYAFSKEEFENATLGVNKLSADSLILQVNKRIELPKAYSYLNEDVKVEIRAQDMEYYLDLSSLKM